MAARNNSPQTLEEKIDQELRQLLSNKFIKGSREKLLREIPPNTPITNLYSLRDLNEIRTRYLGNKSTDALTDYAIMLLCEQKKIQSNYFVIITPEELEAMKLRVPDILRKDVMNNIAAKKRSLLNSNVDYLKTRNKLNPTDIAKYAYPAGLYDNIVTSAFLNPTTNKDKINNYYRRKYRNNKKAPPIEKFHTGEIKVRSNLSNQAHFPRRAVNQYNLSGTHAEFLNQQRKKTAQGRALPEMRNQRELQKLHELHELHVLQELQELQKLQKLQNQRKSLKRSNALNALKNIDNNYVTGGFALANEAARKAQREFLEQYTARNR